MAFKPLKDQGYYFVSKHSGKVLGFKKDQNQDYDILQMEFKPDSEFQRFRFSTLDISQGDYRIKSITCPADQRLIYNTATEGFRMGLHNKLSNEDHEHIVMRKSDFDDDVMALSFDFKIQAAGDGYYRIQVIHSGKYLDVQYASVADNALVVQHQLTGSDNQLFWLLPATEKPDMSKESFEKSNTMIRDGALGLIGGLESVTQTKGVLKFLIGAFWEQKDDLSDLWEKMKVYVDVRIRELIDDDRLERLKSLIGGVMKSVNNIYTRKSTKQLQGPELDKILTTLTLLEGEYVNSKSAKIFPYVVALGTITITLKHALLVEYERFYGVKPGPAELLDKLNDLNDTVEQYIAVATKTKESLLSKRTEYFHNREEKDSFDVNKFYSDDFNGWKLLWQYKDLRSKDYSHSDKLFEQYKKRVSKQFATEVDEYMLPSKVFKYFKPKISEKENASAEELIRVYREDYAAKEEAYRQRALLSEVKVEIGIFGGITATNKFAAEKGKITGIALFLSHPSQLCGIEVFYDKKSSGVKGLEIKSDRYELEDDDYIISVMGFGTERIDGLWFQTRKGKTFGCGNTNTTAYFNADISDGLMPKLTGISGAYNSDGMFGGIEQLSFEWTYIDY